MKNHNDNERRSAANIDGTRLEVHLSQEVHAKLAKIARDRGCRRDDVVGDAINNLFAEIERTREMLSGSAVDSKI